VIALFALPMGQSELNGYLFLTTRLGVVKRVTLADLAKSFGTFSVMNVTDDDAIIAVHVTQGEGEVLLASARGQMIRFAEEDVRPMGFNAGGVAGIRLASEDVVVGADVVQPEGEVAVITEQGTGKRSTMSEFPKQGRAGQGVIGIRTDAGDAVAGIVIAGMKEEVIITTSRGKAKQVKVRLFKSLGRATGGYGVFHVLKNEQVMGLIKPAERISVPEAAEEPTGPIQLELVSEEPVKRSKAKVEKVKVKAASKKAPVTKKTAPAKKKTVKAK
jgi:DNA gyrase subunit A